VSPDAPPSEKHRSEKARWSRNTDRDAGLRLEENPAQVGFFLFKESSRLPDQCGLRDQHD
jgi:hypothetical protein